MNTEDSKRGAEEAEEDEVRFGMLDGILMLAFAEAYSSSMVSNRFMSK